MFIKSYYIDILGINVCIMASMYADFLVLELLKLLILLLRPYYVSLKTISNKLNSDLVFR